MCCEWSPTQDSVDKEACSKCDGVVRVDKGRLLAWDNPSAIGEHGYQVCISVNICADVSVSAAWYVD
jgi:hypothetical protein